MKTKLILLALAMTLALGWSINKALAQDKHGVLMNSKNRSEIFNEIMNNRNMMTEFMNMARHNPQAMNMMTNGMMNMAGEDSSFGMRMGMMMMNNPSIMNGMMQQFMTRADRDSAFCYDVYGMMKQHKTMYGIMQNMMGSSNMMQSGNRMGHMMNYNDGDAHRAIRQ